MPSRLKPAAAPTTPLPSERVNRSEAFQVVGIDFTGPLFIKTKTSNEKSYIALVTCATTRAVHLELVSSLTTECFLLALRRFVARRGLPETTYGDNALTFKRASKGVQSLWKILCSHDTRRLLQLSAHHVEVNHREGSLVGWLVGVNGQVCKSFPAESSRTSKPVLLGASHGPC